MCFYCLMIEFIEMENKDKYNYDIVCIDCL